MRSSPADRRLVRGTPIDKSLINNHHTPFVPGQQVEPHISSAAHEGFSVMVAVAVSTPNVVLRVAVTVAS